MGGRKDRIEEHYEEAERIEREEYKPIVDWIDPSSEVLDVGCGTGSLSEPLVKKKDCKVWGIDISENALEKAEERGLKTRIADVDEGLDYEDDSFDYVILCDILEHVYRPRLLLEEAMRVGGFVEVAAPNVAFVQARLQLLMGKFPTAPLFGYEWHDTQHIHLFSYQDFKELLSELGGEIEREWFHTAPIIPQFLADWFPNMFASVFSVEVKEV